jgi:hypothetical protein
VRSAISWQQSIIHNEFRFDVFLGRRVILVEGIMIPRKWKLLVAPQKLSYSTVELV